MSTTAILSSPTLPIPAEIPGLEVAVAYRPAGSGEEVSGDFYDMFEIGPGDWMVAIGDVSGKGFDAAVLTVLVRDTIRRAALRNPSRVRTTSSPFSQASLVTTSPSSYFASPIRDKCLQGARR